MTEDERFWKDVLLALIGRSNGNASEIADEAIQGANQALLRFKKLSAPPERE